MKKRNIQEQQAYEEGYDAYAEGLDKDQNPYNNDIADYWFDGWNKCRAEYYEHSETE